jgi:hypothetical protein
MHLRNPALLETIFALQGDFARGRQPARKTLAFGIEVAPFKGNADAACCISADFEMGWGFRSQGLAGADAMGVKERRQVPSIIALLGEFSIPITWATVGHLFLESCTRSSAGVAHPDMPRPHASDGTWRGEWYDCDPCSDVHRNPAWYAPDLIQQIIDSRNGHELGTHSFSHINFPSRYASGELVTRELEESAKAMKPFGVKPRSLVFPRNLDEYDYLPQLAAAGIVVVRHREKNSRIRLSYPERTASGVYKIYESMNLRIAKRYDYLQKVKIFMEKAMKRHAVYSLWFHPSDPTDWFDPQLREILLYMDAERRRGRLWIATMQEIAAYCEARDQFDVAGNRSERSLTLSVTRRSDAPRYGDADISLLVPSDRRPISVLIQLADGARMPAPLHVSSSNPQQFMVDVPATAQIITFNF